MTQSQLFFYFRDVPLAQATSRVGPVVAVEAVDCSGIRLCRLGTGDLRRIRVAEFTNIVKQIPLLVDVQALGWYCCRHSSRWVDCSSALQTEPLCVIGWLFPDEQFTDKINKLN